MATPYPGATQVGSYFAGQYYQVLQQQPELVHQFYSDTSSMIRVDGESSEKATTMLHIHSLVMSLNFTAIEITTINSLESWNGGVLIVVSGSVKTKQFDVRRKFVHTFFLAPQEKGYFVLNDIFQFVENGAVFHHQAPFVSEKKGEAEPHPSSPPPEQQDYVLEQEAREYVNSVHIEDDPIDKYSLPEVPEQHQLEDFEGEVVVEEAPVEEVSDSRQVAVDAVQAASAAPAEEPVVETSKQTYASILRVFKEASAVPASASQPSSNKSTKASYEWEQAPQQPALQAIAQQTIAHHPAGQQSHTSSPYMPDYGAEAEDNSGFEDIEFKSVYVRNLPSEVTAAEIEEEFKNFGTIKSDGVFIRNRKDVVGVCYAFVEFEDMAAVENAIKASPILLGGRHVFIEERRPNPSGVRGGRRGGRGRGGYPTDDPRGRFGGRAAGRGIHQEGGDYRPRGNGYYRGAR